MWVKHATKHVFESLEHRNTLAEIKEKIDDLGDLDDLYVRELDSIHKDCKEQAARIFLMSLYANEPIPVLTLYLAGFLANSRSTDLWALSEDSWSHKTQLQAILSKPSDSEELRKDAIGDWDEAEIESVVRDQRKHVRDRAQDFMKVRRSTDNDCYALAVRDRLVFCHRSGRDFLDRQYNKLQELVISSFKVNDFLLKAYSVHVQFIPRSVQDKQEPLQVLLRDIL